MADSPFPYELVVQLYDEQDHSIPLGDEEVMASFSNLNNAKATGRYFSTFADRYGGFPTAYIIRRNGQQLHRYTVNFGGRTTEL